MQKIKTFPLRFTEDHLDKIGVAAKQEGMSKEDFMRYAIDKKVQEAISECNNKYSKAMKGENIKK